MFDKSREWNRKNLNNYFETYLKTNMSILKSRDQKGYTVRLKREKLIML